MFYIFCDTLARALQLLTGNFLEDISQPFLPLLRKADSTHRRADTHLVSNVFSTASGALVVGGIRDRSIHPIQSNPGDSL